MMVWRFPKREVIKYWRINNRGKFKLVDTIITETEGVLGDNNDTENLC